MESVRRRYGLNMKIMTASESTEALWQVDPEKCCSALKVSNSIGHWRARRRE